MLLTTAITPVGWPSWAARLGSLDWRPTGPEGLAGSRLRIDTV